MRSCPSTDPIDEPGGGLGRREFLGAAAGGAAAALLRPLSLSADSPRVAGETVRVRGVVRDEAGRGLGGLAVSDGLQVEFTDEEGRYELLTNTRSTHVHLSLPPGYRIPMNPEGTARFYEPIRPDARGEMEAVFDLERDPAGDRGHVLLLLADPQTEDDYEMTLFHEETVPDARAVVEGLGGAHAFGIGCGDLMFDDLTMFPDYERACRRIGVPFFQVLGNHDLDLEARTTEAASAVYREHFGPEHFSFDRGEVHYVVLNNVFWHGRGYVGYISDAQLQWLRRDLARIEPGRTVIVAIHIPVGNTMDRRLDGNVPVGFTTQNREALYEVLAPYQAYILSGHMHEKEHIIEGSIHEQVNGAVCGAWWSGPICWDGTPNGYGIFHIRGEEVSWQYKSVGYDLDHQMRVYPHGIHPERPDEIVANIWDWDPSWEVVWYEDGERRGPMRQEMGLDPLSIELHQGGDRPERRRWVEPRNTDHLFFAPASRAAGEIVVEARDRFGRLHTARPLPMAEHQARLEAAHPLSTALRPSSGARV